MLGKIALKSKGGDWHVVDLLYCVRTKNVMVPTHNFGRRQSYPNPIRMVRKSFRLGL